MVFRRWGLVFVGATCVWALMLINMTIVNNSTEEESEKIRVRYLTAELIEMRKLSSVFIGDQEVV